MSVTDLEIKEATWGAWTILYAGAPSCACRLAAALLAVTRGTQAHPHWVPSDDLWRDRLAAWGPQPGAPALLQESQMWRGDTYLLWRSTVQVSTDDDGKSITGRRPPSRSRCRNDTEQTASARPRIRRRGSPPPEANVVPD
jgi:hypothetical protein